MNEHAISEPAEIWRPSAAMHPARLAALWDLAQKIAFSAAVPETLRGERKGSAFEAFDDRTILANVFAVVEQADRWNVSAFALLQSAAIVRGKLCFEGKVIAAVLEDQFGIALHAYYRGEPGTDTYQIYLCDEELPDDVLAQLAPNYRHDRYRIMDGSVATWKTTANGSPWRPATYADMLMYRGVRQWVRVYKSRVLLGVISDDEAQAIALENAAQNAVPIGHRFSTQQKDGFSADNVTRALAHNPQQPMELVDAKVVETVNTNSEAQPDAKAKPTSPGPTASAKPAEDSAGGAGSTVSDGSQPQKDPSSTAPALDGDDGKGGDATAPVRVSADLWNKYHSALARVTSVEKVSRMHEEFWNNGAGKGIAVKHPDDLKLGGDIIRVHKERAEGKIPADVVATEIAGWIKQVAGE